ncbi:MAG: DUF2892 domain-containing protein [Bacteroidota bacterium]
MKTNENFNERALRLVAGVIIASFFIYNNSAWAFLGLIPFVTGAIGFCPLYFLIGYSSNK